MMSFVRVLVCLVFAPFAVIGGFTFLVDFMTLFGVGDGMDTGSAPLVSMVFYLVALSSIFFLSSTLAQWGVARRMKAIQELLERRK